MSECGVEAGRKEGRKAVGKKEGRNELWRKEGAKEGRWEGGRIDGGRKD